MSIRASEGFDRSIGVVLVTPVNLDVKIVAQCLETRSWDTAAWRVVGLFVLAAVMMPMSVVSDIPRPQVDKQSIVVLGDSLAAGYGLDPSESFPALLQEKIDAGGWRYRVVNAGLSGDTSAGGLRRLDWLLKQKIDILILELGGNDGLRGIKPESTRTNLQAIIDRARQKNPVVRVIIAGMRMPPNLGVEYVERFQAIFPTLAKENHALLVPFLLEGVGGLPELNQADRIHPTAQGQQIVAENVWRVLKPLVTESASSSGAGS